MTRVLAPNPSPMTLEGTNTYVVATPESGTAVVIDPGPPDPEHLDRVIGATRGRGVELVLLTHTHPDHAEGAAALAARVGAPLGALDPEWATAGAPGLAAGVGLRVGGVELEPLPTPGHAADHCCFWLGAERAMFTGDHILGRRWRPATGRRRRWSGGSTRMSTPPCTGSPKCRSGRTSSS